jgi:hypothetical protein
MTDKKLYQHVRYLFIHLSKYLLGDSLSITIYPCTSISTISIPRSVSVHVSVSRSVHLYLYRVYLYLYHLYLYPYLYPYLYLYLYPRRVCLYIKVYPSIHSSIIYPYISPILMSLNLYPLCLCPCAFY